MSPPSSPRRLIHVLSHHNKPLTEELAWSLVERLRPGRYPLLGGGPMTPEEEQEMFEHWLRPSHAYGSTSFYYRRPQGAGAVASPNLAEIAVNLAPSARWAVSSKKVVEFPLLERERGRWFMVTSGGRSLDYDSVLETAWLFDKVHHFFHVFEPDFAFAEVDVNFMKRFDESPQRRVWPVLVYGPERVAAMGGRERVLEAPAWRVEELSYGGMWIQVAENPFLAKRKELAKLAEYLGLEGPG